MYTKELFYVVGGEQLQIGRHCGLFSVCSQSRAALQHNLCKWQLYNKFITVL